MDSPPLESQGVRSAEPLLAGVKPGRCRSHRLLTITSAIKNIHERQLSLHYINGPQYIRVLFAMIPLQSTGLYGLTQIFPEFISFF